MKMIILVTILLTSSLASACKITVKNTDTSEEKYYSPSSFPFKLPLPKSLWSCTIKTLNLSSGIIHTTKCYLKKDKNIKIGNGATKFNDFDMLNLDDYSEKTPSYQISYCI